MIGKTNVFGGGAALNLSFKAYANEAALNADTPAENTVGIVTTTAIGKACVKATQPTTISGAAVAEGDVWILDGTASPAAANISKKNGVEVWAYPLSCKQYVSGTWVAKTAKSYIGGVWVEWYIYLYETGKTPTGWTGEKSGSHCTYTIDSTKLQTYTTNGNESGYIYSRVEKEYNFEGMSTIRVTFASSYIDSDGGNALRVYNSSGTVLATLTLNLSTSEGTIQTLDISNCQGATKVSVISYKNGGWNYGINSVTIAQLGVY